VAARGRRRACRSGNGRSVGGHPHCLVRLRIRHRRAIRVADK
jgi:hypothetical protein